MAGPLTQVTDIPFQESQIPEYAGMSDDQLSKLPHATLIGLRKLIERVGDNSSNHSLADLNIRIAPLEHQAFAREETQTNPVRGALASGIIMPVYQGLKMLGQNAASLLNQNDGVSTPPSLDQILATYKGIGQGWKNAWDNRSK